METNQEFIEAMLSAIVAEVGPDVFCTALNNISAYGEVFIKYGCDLYTNDKEDATLHQWFEGLELLTKAAKKFEKMT